jgi:hypothetical protein
MTGVLVNAVRLAKPAVFDSTIQSARAALLDTPRKPYEAALVVLGQLAGAVPSAGDSNNNSAPDATWIFGTAIWVAWEAKSDARTDGELGANDVRQAGSHLRFIATKCAESAPGDSPAMLMTPQARVHPSAHAVAERHVYLVRPGTVVDLIRPAGARVAYRPHTEPRNPSAGGTRRDRRRRRRPPDH